MPKPQISSRAYSGYIAEAARLLGRQIRLGRKQRKWAESELAERAGISRATVQKIEKGDLTCVIGLVFETAALVGVRLFDAERSTLALHSERTDDRIALLARHVHRARKGVDDDF